LAGHVQVLRHPLFIAVAAAVLGSILIPQITREWQDRQKENDLKQSLLEEISTSSTTAVRQGVSLVDGSLRAAGGEEHEDKNDVYAQLRNSWLIHRASARSRVIVYFPHLYGCWYSFENAVADFLSIGSSPPSDSRQARVAGLERYVSTDFSASYLRSTAKPPATTSTAAGTTTSAAATTVAATTTTGDQRNDGCKSMTA
jgi:hypothetical protein